MDKERLRIEMGNIENLEAIQHETDFLMEMLRQESNEKFEARLKEALTQAFKAGYLRGVEHAEE